MHLTTYRGIFYLHVEQCLALYALMDFFGFVETAGVLSVSVSDFVVWDGGLAFSGISEAGSIPEELLLGLFLFSFLVVWLHNLVFNKPFCS
jgi:hypothetical protein